MAILGAGVVTFLCGTLAGSDQGMVHLSRDISGAFLQYTGAERGVPRRKFQQGNWKGDIPTQPCSVWSSPVNMGGRECCSSLFFGQGGRNRWDWCWFHSKPASFWTSAVKSHEDKTVTTACFTPRVTGWSPENESFLRIRITQLKEKIHTLSLSFSLSFCHPELAEINRREIYLQMSLWKQPLENMWE